MECQGHSHDHDHEDDQGVSLYDYIDTPHAWCLNEETTNSGQKILKEYEYRFTETPSLRSQEVDDDDEDPELLLHVPFTETVSLKFITIRGISSAEDGTAGPKTVKLFVDRDDIDFETANELTPAMKLDLVPPEHEEETANGTIDYPVRPAGRFQNISSITLYFPDNFGVDETIQTEITFVGFKGKATNFRRKAVQCVYESRGMLKDHKVPDGELGSKTRNLF